MMLGLPAYLLLCGITAAQEACRAAAVTNLRFATEVLEPVAAHTAVLVPWLPTGAPR